VEAKNDYRPIGLVKSRKSLSNCRGAEIMFVSTEINAEIKPLVNWISDCLMPTPKGPDSPGPSPLRMP
jgi:hypothetical protein